MKPQEDIGSLIKTKLQATEKVSNEATWDRIQHSLEARKKKRRFAFYMKLGSASLLVLIGVLLFINYTTGNDNNEILPNEEIKLNTNNHKETNSKKEENSQTTTSNPESNVILKNDLTEEIKTTKSQHKEHEVVTESLSKKSETLQTTSNTKSNATLENDATEETKIAKQHRQEKESVAQASSKKEKPSNSENKSTTHKAKDISEAISATNKENASANTSEKTPLHTAITDTIVNRYDVPVTQTTQKIYYYSNSKNGQEISSTNKHVIDSIVKANQVQQDSLKSKN